MEEMFSRIGRLPSEFLHEICLNYSASQKVGNISRWLTKFDALTQAVDAGTGKYRQVEDHVFELKVISLIRNQAPDWRIVYEPAGINTSGKNCDLMVLTDQGQYLIELKSFHPDDKETEIPAKHVTQNNLIIMDPTTYHGYQSVRDHLIDVVAETEEKLNNYPKGYTTVLGVPEGFHLNIEDLRDFVFIYRHNRPRADDPLGAMTMHSLTQRYNGTIDQFWAFPFIQDSFGFRPGGKITIVAPLKSGDLVLSL